MRSLLSGALFLAALSGIGCKTTTTVTLAELNALKPERAWVREGGNSMVIVDGPQVVGDTIVGYVNGVYEEMPSDKFSQIVVQKNATTRTLLLVGAVTVGFGGMIYALIGSTGGDKYLGSDYCEEHPFDPDCDSGASN